MESLSELKGQLSEFPVDLGKEDELVWSGDSSGHFSVKSLIVLVQLNSDGTSSLSGLVWKGLAPPSVRTFVWCGMKRKIPTRVDLRRRGLLRLEEDLAHSVG